ncbi:hypothetical protein FB45DRAFT_519561 [Roridomyces roridus]|uniref:Replication protein A subunit n=1 Tax=Roridomyces roridus TaxID=1738132 RepID=A0AAD7BXF0_9AGAR|nr:hypothetical protein FB45DRAFT_519561 [Roridomyces roridus]
MVNLSTGICARLQTAEQTDLDLFDGEHILQLLSVKHVGAGNSTTGAVERYRIILSDGEYFLQAMLATQLNGLFQDNSIQKNTIVKVTKMTCNFVQGKRLLIVLALDVVEHVDQKIGNPASYPTPTQEVPATTTNDMDAVPSAPVQQASTSSSHQTTSTAPTAQTAQRRPAANGNRPIYPIEGLSPYQNNWTIKARVTQKSDIKTYSNQKGEGQLFNVTLMDDTGEIRATGFNQVVTALYERLVVGKVYYISGARVNIAKKQFSHLNNEYELGLEKNTSVEECLDTDNLPTIKYNFVALSDLESQPKDSTCDIIGLVQAVGDVTEITTKTNNKKVTKRELTLVDRSEYSVRLTLWGKQAEEFSSPDSVLACKGVKVSDFGGRSLSVFSSSTMVINPDIQEAHTLRGWYDNQGKDVTYSAHQSSGGGAGGGGGGGFVRKEVRSLGDVKSSQLGQGDRNDFFCSQATVVFMKPDSMWYPACQKPDCNKKVVGDDAGWRCEKCDQSWPQPQYRYIMTLACSDYSGQAWLQGFNDVGDMIFGKTADEMFAIKEDSEIKFTELVQAATCEPYNFLCRARTDHYNGQPRVRYGISRIQKLDYKEEAKYLRDMLMSPWGQTAVAVAV